MNATGMRKLIGKVVTFESNRTRPHRKGYATGEVEHVLGIESYIAGGWHYTRSVEIIKVHDEPGLKNNVLSDAIKSIKAVADNTMKTEYEAIQDLKELKSEIDNCIEDIEDDAE